MITLLAALVMQAALPTTAPVESVTVRDSMAQQQRPRPKAIEYSDWYYRRLTIHRIGSYVELPLFAWQYSIGQRMISTRNPSASLQQTHGALATSVAVLFSVNTATGLWNLYDSRNDPAGRARRITHSVIMMAADAGFLLTGASAGESEGGQFEGSGSFGRSNASRHRQIAITSMGISAAGTVLMWLWRDR